MKNLKKVSRKELKNLVGGKKVSTVKEGGLSEENCYQCCKTLYDCGGCGTSSNCPSGQFLRAC